MTKLDIFESLIDNLHFFFDLFQGKEEIQTLLSHHRPHYRRVAGEKGGERRQVITRVIRPTRHLLGSNGSLLVVGEWIQESQAARGQKVELRETTRPVLEKTTS